MMTNGELLILLHEPGGYEIAWDYCLEHEIIMPGMYVYEDNNMGSSTARWSISSRTAARRSRRSLLYGKRQSTSGCAVSSCSSITSGYFRSCIYDGASGRWGSITDG